jgi:hypothetical protein
MLTRGHLSFFQGDSTLLSNSQKPDIRALAATFFWFSLCLRHKTTFYFPMKIYFTIISLNFPYIIKILFLCKIQISYLPSLFYKISTQSSRQKDERWQIWFPTHWVAILDGWLNIGNLMWVGFCDFLFSLNIGKGMTYKTSIASTLIQ